MKIIREWKDNGDREEISMKELRSKLAGNYKDVNLCIESMLGGCPAQTCFARYYIEDAETRSPLGHEPGCNCLEDQLCRVTNKDR